MARPTRRAKQPILIAVVGNEVRDPTLQCKGGDTCVRTAGGGLLFRSGFYQSPGKPAVRVVNALTSL